MSAFISGLSSALGGSSMGSAIGSTLGSGLIGGIKTGISNVLNKRAQNRQFAQSKILQQQQYEYNMALAQQAYDNQLDFWQTQQEYNTPAQQRKRLEDAGLNPALMYGAGQGANVAGGLSSVPNPSVGLPASGSGMPSSLQIDPATASVIRLNDAQAELAEERADTEGHQRKLLDSTAALNDANTFGAKLHSEYQRIVNEIADATKEVTVEKALADLNQTFALTDKFRVEQQTEKFKALHTEASIKKIDDEIKVLQSQAALNTITAVLRQSGIRLNEAQITSIEAITRVNNADALFKEALNDNNYSDSVVFKSWTDSIHNLSGSAAQVINSIWDIVKVFIPAAKRTEVTNVLREMFDQNGNPKGVTTTQTTTTSVK